VEAAGRAWGWWVAAQVKQIQEEYQAYMEGVRATAQGAIDQANALFQALRQDATHTLDNAIHYLQSRFFAMQVLVRHPHRRRMSHCRRHFPSSLFLDSYVCIA
jgi:hypothetical protein